MICFRTILLLLFFFAPTISIATALEKNYRIAVIHKGSSLEFWQIMHQGVQIAAKEMNVKIDWVGASYSDNAAAQIKLVDSYVAQGVDAIVLIPADKKALVESVKRATEEGIKVVVIDSDLEGRYHETFIGTDNLKAGRVAARRLADLVPPRGSIAIVRTVKGSASTDSRAQGFREEIKKLRPKIRILHDEYGGGLVGSAHRTMKKILASSEQQLDGVFSVNESSTEGVLIALREAKLAEDIPMVGFDSNPTLLQGITNGEIQALIVQDPKLMGYLGLKAAFDALGDRSVAPQIHTGVTVIDHANLKSPDLRPYLVMQEASH